MQVSVATATAPHVNPQNSLVLEPEVCALWPPSPHFLHRPALGNHILLSFLWVQLFYFYCVSLFLMLIFFNYTWHWILYWVQVYSIVVRHLYNLQSDPPDKSSTRPSPNIVLTSSTFLGSTCEWDLTALAFLWLTPKCPQGSPRLSHVAGFPSSHGWTVFPCVCVCSYVSLRTGYRLRRASLRQFHRGVSVAVCTRTDLDGTAASAPGRWSSYCS